MCDYNILLLSAFVQLYSQICAPENVNSLSTAAARFSAPNAELGDRLKGKEGSRLCSSKKFS